MEIELKSLKSTGDNSQTIGDNSQSIGANLRSDHKNTCQNDKMYEINEVNRIKKDINKLSVSDLKEVISYCDEKHYELKKEELQSKIIIALKKRYKDNSQLVTLANGFKIIKYNKKRDKKYCENFEIEFCNISDNCNKDGCLHLSFKCVSDNIDHGITNITYCLADNRPDVIDGRPEVTFSQNKEYTYFGWCRKSYFEFDDNSIEKITDGYLLDREHLKSKYKEFFGLCTTIENKLCLYFRDIIQAIASYN
jgi:hypothetical protein